MEEHETTHEPTLAEILEPYLEYDGGEKCLAWYFEQFNQS